MYTRIEIVDGQEVATHNLQRPTRIGNTFIGKKESDLTKYGYYEESTEKPVDTLTHTHRVSSYIINGSEASLVYEPIQKDVPQRIDALNALVAIDDYGLSAQYEAWATDPTRTFRERVFIEKAKNWRRDDPVLMSAAASMGLTSAQIDEMFIYAGSLNI